MGTILQLNKKETKLFRVVMHQIIQSHERVYIKVNTKQPNWRYSETGEPMDIADIRKAIVDEDYLRYVQAIDNPDEILELCDIDYLYMMKVFQTIRQLIFEAGYSKSYYSLRRKIRNAYVKRKESAAANEEG